MCFLCLSRRADKSEELQKVGGRCLQITRQFSPLGRAAAQKRLQCAPRIKGRVQHKGCFGEPLANSII